MWIGASPDTCRPVDAYLQVHAPAHFPNILLNRVQSLTRFNLLWVRGQIWQKGA